MREFPFASRPRPRRSRPAGRVRRGWVVFALLGLLASFVPVARVGFAQEADGGAVPAGDFKLLEPIKNQLGASAWLAASGYDPRLWNVPTGEAARNVVDWGAFGAPAAAAGPRGVAFAPPVPFRSPAPAFSRNLIVTRQLGLFPLQTEPSLAVDPFDPDHLVLGTIDYNFPSMSTYVSFDGGATWEGPNQTRYFTEDLTAAGDPVVAFDRAGNVYMASISIGVEPYRIGSLVSASEVSSMIINRSTDGGLTWENAVSTSRATIETTSSPDASGRERGTITIGFLDKPWLTIGPNPADPSQDTIYLSYTEFKTTYSLLYADELPFLTSPLTETTIKVVHSNDGGATWSEPVAASPTVLQAEGASEPGEGEGAGGAQAGGASGGTGGEGAAKPLDAAMSPAVRAAFESRPGSGDGSVAIAAAAGTSGAVAGQSAAQESGQQSAGEATRQQQQQEQQQQPAETPPGQEEERTVQGSQPGVLSDGTLVVSYLDTTTDGIQKGLATAMVAISKDGGQTFAEPVQAGVFNEIHFQPRNSNFRWWGAAFPQLAIGPKDEIYLALTAAPPDKPTDDGDVYLFRSFDKGATWQDPVRVNQDDTTRIQFFPSIKVSPDGTLNAMWGDMRDDPNEARYNIYYSQSKDQGATWGFVDQQTGLNTPDTRVTDFASNALKGFPGGRFLGDYFSLTASDKDVYMVWADTRLGEYGGPNQQIGFARRTAITPPSIFLNPASGDAGRDVTIQGLNFQANSNISIDVQGITITNLRSDDKGQFTTDVFMPVTGEGARNVSAFDETGNVATVSFYTTFGFDTIAKALNQAGLAGTPPAVPPSPPGTPIPGATPVASPTP